MIDDTTQDALYLVLEYVPGGAIMEYNVEEKRYHYAKSRDGTMAEVKAAKVLCDVLSGLIYLHMHHICHRDLKPEVGMCDLGYEINMCASLGRHCALHSALLMVSLSFVLLLTANTYTNRTYYWTSTAIARLLILVSRIILRRKKGKPCPTSR